MSAECNLKGRITKPEDQVDCEGEVTLYENIGMYLCQKHFLLISSLESFEQIEKNDRSSSSTDVNDK